MKLYDVEQSGQDGISDAGHSGSGGPRPAPKKSFDGFKV